MAKVKVAGSSSSDVHMRPALSPENDESQMISLTMNLVKKRLIEGTASSQETTHFLKLASAKARLEKEILEKQRDLITAKTEQLQSQKRMEELYSEAIAAMRRYSGQGDSDDEYQNLFRAHLFTNIRGTI